MNPLPPASPCSAPECVVPARHRSGRCGLHFDPSPGLVIERYERGAVKTIHYLRNPEATRRSAVNFYRLDGPGVVEFREDGSVRSEVYFALGVVHRGDGPARIDYDGNGDVTSYSYRWRGKTHREDGPAEAFLRDGRVISASYARNGRVSRIDGPAIISVFDPNNRGYHFRDEPFNTLAEVGAELARLTTPEIENEVRKSSFARLLDDGLEAPEVARAIAAGCTTAEGITAYLGGAPIEWVQAFEQGSRD